VSVIGSARYQELPEPLCADECVQTPVGKVSPMVAGARVERQLKSGDELIDATDESTPYER